MSQLISRLLLTVFLVPLTLLLALMLTILCQETIYPYNGYYVFDRRLQMSIIVGGLSWAFFAVCWIGIWRRGVRWTDRRRVWSIAWPFASAVIGILVGVAFQHLDAYTCYFLGSVTPPLAWVVGTVVIWRETDAERKERQKAAHVDVLVCPTCGYNLTGLSEARCPECGSKFTLNDLYAHQPGRDAGRVEQELSA